MGWEMPVCLATLPTCVELSPGGLSAPRNNTGVPEFSHEAPGQQSSLLPHTALSNSWTPTATGGLQWVSLLFTAPIAFYLF